MDILILESQRCYPQLVFSAADVDFARDKTMPGSWLRKILVELIIRDLGIDFTSPNFQEKGNWCREVVAEVFARMAESKQTAVEMFAREMNRHQMNRAFRSVVVHPKDNKNKCADYHKHGEGYTPCT